MFRYNNIELYLTNQDLIFAENIDKKISADVFIFASKHRSKENKPSLTVHPIGNWNKADFGGKEKKLCFSSAFLLKDIFIVLNQNAQNKGYEITLEATHHGPYVEKPAVFVEIGSTEKEWNDKENGEIIATTIINALNNQNKDYKSCIVIGGGHYSQSANKLMLRTNYAVGHICSKYALEYLDEEMLIQAINKTIPKSENVLVDWKGLGQYKQKTIALLEKLNLRYERV
ncbi:hypothetical protein HYW99_04505 [Candidatus Woesearchaeota archaeon]|nr:hypothetical protein [Candidatus Woesearchaeota archaeon]